MVDDMIDDGDIVVLEPANTCDDGERVAVWLKDEGETMLKRLYREGERVRLQSSNAAAAPIYTSTENCEVQGRLLSAFRIEK